MNHADHVNLLDPAKLPPGGVWADFGAGSGAFTLALRELLGSRTAIYAVDKDHHSLSALEKAYRARFGDTRNLHLLSADFTRPIDPPPLDGLLMANSLHFFKDQESILRLVSSFLKPEGCLLLVEYNVDAGNPWVPHPLSFQSFHLLALQAGLNDPRLLATHPSRFLREFYSAQAGSQ